MYFAKQFQASYLQQLMCSHVIAWKSQPVIIPILQMRKRRHGDELSCVASQLTPACSEGDVTLICGLE